MFLKKRTNQTYPQYNQVAPENFQASAYIPLNDNSLELVNQEISELKRHIMELTKRLNMIENYLGMQRESNASNYQD